jgi:hypothetical protein
VIRFIASLTQRDELPQSGIIIVVLVLSVGVKTGRLCVQYPL